MNLRLFLSRYLPAWILMLLMLPIVWVARSEWIANREFHQRLEQLRASHVPVDSETQLARYLNLSSPEGTNVWTEVFRMSATGIYDDHLPIFGSSEDLPNLLAPELPWKSEERVERFLDEMKPLRSRISDAAKFPVPVTMPIGFHGWSTNLELAHNARQTARILRLDLEYALYVGDSQRALQDIEFMSLVHRAALVPECYLLRLVATAIEELQDEGILRSLFRSSWTQEELEYLIQLESVRRLSPNTLVRAMEGERALHLQSIQSSTFGDGSWNGHRSPEWMALFPSSKLRVLKCWDRAIAALQQRKSPSVWLQSLGDIDRETEDIYDNIWDISGAHWKDSSVSLSGLLQEEIRSEDSRRWVRTALGLQKYRMTNGEWPSRLEDLSSVQMTPNDLVRTDGISFGYKVEGSTCYLWTGDRKNGYAISETRPSRNSPADSNETPFHLHLLEMHGDEPR